MSGHDINRVQYSGFDFHTHYDELIARIQVQFAASFNDFTVSSMAILLVDTFSYGLDTLSFYLDRRASDAYIATARTESAMSRLTHQIDYKMRGAVASSVPVSLQINSAFAVPVSVTAGRAFQGPDDLVFEAARTVVFNPGDGAKDILCYEGITQTETFTARGVADEVFELRRLQDGRYLMMGSVRVRVNGALWTENDFLTFEQTSQFEVDYISTPPKATFGDGVAGNIAPVGATVSISYVATRGREGRAGAGTITSLVTPLVVGGSALDCTITNSESSAPGDDPETLDEARHNGPWKWKARGVAVTRPDYVGLSQAYADPTSGRIAVAEATSTHSADNDLTLKAEIATIDTEIAALPVDVAAEIAAARTRMGTIGSNLGVITTKVGDLAVNTSGADADLATAHTRNDTSEGNAALVVTEASEVNTRAASAQATIGGITVASPDQLTSATKNLLLDTMNRLQSLGTTISGRGTTMGSDLASEDAAIGAARTKLATAGLTISTGLLGDVKTAYTAAQAALGTNSPATALYLNVLVIEQKVVDPATSRTQTILTATGNIFDHVDGWLSADGTANVVTVPILARNAAGFYEAPSVALIRSLQTYLEVRKEVTQVVRVVSGDSVLVKPVLTLRVGVLQGYSLTVIELAVRSAVDGLLRDRQFGVSLYISDIYDVVSPIAGVGFCNITIDGVRVVVGSTTTVQTTKLDSNGNLLIAGGEIITKDSALPDPVTITTVSASTP